MKSHCAVAPNACCHHCEGEKDEAVQIQQSLLPVGNLKDPLFEIACRFSPFAEVGGDFADYFQLPDGQVGLYIGDVVGKGITSAMHGSLVMGMLRGINKTGEDTASVLAMLNRRLLVRPVRARYCATLYALYNPETRDLSFSNAGIPRPLLVAASGCRSLGEGGLPSRLFPGSEYETHTVRLAPGDMVLFATDGLHELRNPAREDFCLERIYDVWAKCRGRSAEDSLDYLFEGARSFSQGVNLHDDITTVALRVPVIQPARVADDERQPVLSSASV
jgi:serine phosphatase RsbU (regulator of sigma subunit)